jgi:hypothetical protein
MYASLFTWESTEKNGKNVNIFTLFGLKCDLRGESMYPLALYSLSDGTLVAGIKKAFLQSWQDEPALMHGPSTAPVDLRQLEWMAENCRPWLPPSLYLLGWLELNPLQISAAVLRSFFSATQPGLSLLMLLLVLCGSCLTCKGVSFKA